MYHFDNQTPLPVGVWWRLVMPSSKTIIYKKALPNSDSVSPDT